MTRKLLKGKIPPLYNGYHWYLPVAEGVTLYSMTEELLIKAVFEYRMRNNLPIGNIEADIDLFYCTKHPPFCTPDNVIAPPSRESMLNRVTRWAAQLAAKMPRGGYPLVAQDEADRRSAICFQCPKNVPWKTGCAGCSATTSTLLAQLRQNRISNRQGNLMACHITGADNLTGVHLPNDTYEVTQEQRDQFPAACWRR